MVDDIQPLIIHRGYGKKWLILTCFITLLFAWYLFDKRILPLEIARVSELVFEGALLNMLPIPKILNDEFVKNVTSILSPFSLYEPGVRECLTSPGRELFMKGMRANYSVIMIPGVVNSSLELWQGKPCAQKYFRQRVWGTLSMIRILLLDKDCWVQHMKLDAVAQDPEGVKVRAAQGLESSDFILPGFWVWGKIIQNLAEVGYDHKNLIMAPYDWRVDFLTLETRDGYLTRLKSIIEQQLLITGKKVVIISHSLGSILWLFFMQWVETNLADSVPHGHGGNGGEGWIDKHIHAFVDIAGPKLGVPKSLSCIISGEMKDTVQLGKLETYVLDRLLSKSERTSLFRTWVGPLVMLQKGGSAIWDTCCDRPCKSSESVPGILEILNPKCDFSPKYTHSDLFILLRKFLPEEVADRVEKMYSLDFPVDSKELPLNKKIVNKWSNPLEVSLPIAPKMKIYSFYGIGKETERGYMYKHLENSLCKLNATEVVMVVNILLEDLEIHLSKGLYHSDGDGTVPLISLGIMGASLWKKADYNPSNMKIITKEYKHEPSASVSEFRGGEKTADHVDILGNKELTEDLLSIVTGMDDENAIIKERFLSSILNIINCLNLR
jgi:phospholipid:diacylglycerol acyltransferase